MEGHQRLVPAKEPIRDLSLRPFQRDRTLVERQAVETGAVLGGEGFEAVESAFFIEERRIAFEREGRVEDAGAAAGGFLRVPRVRRAVGAEENVRRARDCRPPDRDAVLLPLGDGQAISVRANAALEDRVAREENCCRPARES